MIRSLSAGQKAALIVNECQVGLLDPSLSMFPALGEQVAARNMVANIAEVVKAFRAKGLPIFFTPALQRRDMIDKKINSMISALSAKAKNLIEGTPEAAFSPGLEPEENDFVIQRGSGLIATLGTSLDLTLRRMGIETLVVTGVSTNVAIPGITISAVEFGYHVVIPEDCIAGADPEAHKVIIEHQLRMMATITDRHSVIAAIGGGEAGNKSA
jgi:nicotinamidase-related amidase